MDLVITAKAVALTGSFLAMGSYLVAQIAGSVNPNAVPDALGTTVLTVGGGGVALAITAVLKDYWNYKKQLMDSIERRAKEDRESNERIETAKLALDRMRIRQSKNDRLTTAMLDWMEEAHAKQTWPAPPPRIRLDDREHNQ